MSNKYVIARCLGFNHFWHMHVNKLGMEGWEKESCICRHHINQLVWLTLANSFPVKYLYSYYSFPSNRLSLHDLFYDSLKELLWDELSNLDGQLS